MNSETIDFLEQTSTILGIDSEKLINAAKGKTIGQINFLDTLSNRFNSHNFYISKEERESGELVMDLFNRIKNPKKEHVSFVKHMNMSMTDIKKCFDKCKDNPEKIGQLENVCEKLDNIAGKNDLTIQIVESPNMAEYVENIDKYIPHFSAYKDTKGIIENLDKQMETKTVDLTSKVKEKQINQILKNYPNTSGLNEEILSNNYSREGIDILNTIKVKINPTQKSIEEGDLKGIINRNISDTFEIKKYWIY